MAEEPTANGYDLNPCGLALTLTADTHPSVLARVLALVGPGYPLRTYDQPGMHCWVWEYVSTRQACEAHDAIDEKLRGILANQAATYSVQVQPYSGPLPIDTWQPGRKKPPQ